MSNRWKLEKKLFDALDTDGIDPFFYKNRNDVFSWIENQYKNQFDDEEPYVNVEMVNEDKIVIEISSATKEIKFYCVNKNQIIQIQKKSELFDDEELEKKE